MSVRRVTPYLVAFFLCASSTLHAEYYVLSVDSASPAVPIYFRSDIIALPQGTVLSESYHFVFDRENNPDAKWLLVTPPPRADSVGELVAGLLKFAWAPLSDGLRLHVYLRCIPMHTLQTQSTTFLSGMNVAFAIADLVKDYASIDDLTSRKTFASVTTPTYDSARAQQLFKKNVAEREGRAMGSVTVRALVSETGYVEFAEIKKSTNPKLNVSALRTAVCTRFEPVLENGVAKSGWVELQLKAASR